jgi:hypothetical protein
VNIIKILRENTGMKNRGENWKIRNKMDPVIAIIILKVNS